MIEEVAESGPRLVEALARAGFAVRICPDARTGLHAFLCELPDLIVAHERGTDPGGAALLREIREISDVPVLLVGGAASEPGLNRALGVGADRVWAASVDAEEVARLAAEIVVEPSDEIEGDAGDATSRTPVARRRRLTAARVRRLARSELEAELERQLLDCRGNLAEMARRMGKDRSTIRYHLRRFGMLVEDRSVRPDQAPRAASDSRRSPA